MLIEPVRRKPTEPALEAGQTPGKQRGQKGQPPLFYYSLTVFSAGGRVSAVPQSSASIGTPPEIKTGLAALLL